MRFNSSVLFSITVAEEVLQMIKPRIEEMVAEAIQRVAGDRVNIQLRQVVRKDFDRKDCQIYCAVGVYMYLLLCIGLYVI